MRRKSTGKSATKSPGWTQPSITLYIYSGRGVYFGIGIGIAFSSTTTLDQITFASRAFIDESAPNPEFVCSMEPTHGDGPAYCVSLNP